MTRQCVNSIQQIGAFLGGFGIGWDWQSTELCDRTMASVSTASGRVVGWLTRGSDSSGTGRAEWRLQSVSQPQIPILNPVHPSGRSPGWGTSRLAKEDASVTCGLSTRLNPHDLRGTSVGDPVAQGKLRPRSHLVGGRNSRRGPPA